MLQFKRDKIFKQFLPVVGKLEELVLNRDSLKSGGIVKVYNTAKDASFVIEQFVVDFEFKLIKQNENASKYQKIDRGFQILLIYNKNDKSMMLTLSRLSKEQVRLRKNK